MQRKTLVIFALIGLAACVQAGANISFGTDAGPYANDGECDDPRFTGGAMAASLNVDNIKNDATDCRELFAASRIRVQRTAAQFTPQQCASVNFGNNSASYANDGECDDPRFTGPGVDEIMLSSDLGTDANDCRALCQAGEVWLK